LVVSSCSIFQALASSAATSTSARACPLPAPPAPLQQALLLHRLLVAAAHLAHEVLQPLLDAFQIGQHQLGLDGLGVGHRVDAALDMGDVAILETAQHMGDGVDLADIGEELVAQPLALGRALHQPGDVDEGHPRRDDLLRLRDLGQLVEPRIGHRHLADIGLDGAEREIRRLRRGGAVSALNSVDLPTFGSPTMPILKPMRAASR
jgi:hypothetical protein